MTKICNTCGKEVDDAANFCTHCKGRSFKPKYEITSPNNDLVHRLFYWQYPQGSMLSKSKIAGIGVFLYLIIFWIGTSANLVASIFLSIIFGLATFLIGLLGHKILPEPPSDKIKNNDYGLLSDLKHLLFYWQDRNGGYIPSKTKILSFAIFILMFGVGLATMNGPVVLVSIIFALLFGIPAFLIGFGIHKLVFKDTSKHVIPEKRQKPKKIEKQEVKSIKGHKVIPEYVDYQMQIDDLNAKFIQKDKFVRKIIEKRFEPPQLTYTRFISGVDKSKELFNKNLNSALTMINLADEYSPRISGEIESKIEILKEINRKLDALGSEMVLNEEESGTGEIENLLDDMDSLIGSVKDYDN